MDPQGPGDTEAPSPQAIVAELLTVAPLLGPTLTAVGMGTKGARALVDLAKREGPILVHAIASWREDDLYCIALRLINVTFHASYLEAVITKKPKGIALKFATERESPSMSMGAPSTRQLKWNARLEPMLIAGGNETTVIVGAIDDVRNTLALEKSLEVELTLSFVAGRSPETVEKAIKCLLRHSGPPYTP